MDIIERFKKYVSFDTTSSETIRPGKASTDRQYAFGKEVIYKELKTFTRLLLISIQLPVLLLCDVLYVLQTSLYSS